MSSSLVGHGTTILPCLRTESSTQDHDAACGMEKSTRYTVQSQPVMTESLKCAETDTETKGSGSNPPNPLNPLNPINPFF